MQAEANTGARPTDQTTHWGAAGTIDVAIIGAGISGIGMAAHLAQRCPDLNYTVLDRREAIGGTWDLFRYPGIRCDSDMFTLGYSFAPWQGEKTITTADTICTYLNEVSDRFGVTDRIRFNSHVLAADWDSATALWSLRLADGATIQARFLFLGAGYYDYDEAHKPDIPGLENFKGKVLHPQFWPEDYDYSGKQVVIIGSGATAVTMVPVMAAKAAHVTMLQRTPTWYVSMPSRDWMANGLRKLLPYRLAHRLIRARNVLMADRMYKRARTKPQKVADWLTKRLKADLGDKWNEKDFVPPYNPWEQRMCLVPDGDMFKAIVDGKASVATGHIKQVEADAIVLQDGTRIAADCIVTATGLKLAVGGKIAVSVDGCPVNFGDHFWFRNCMFSNVPNLAAMFGYLNASWTLRVDVVASYLVRVIEQMKVWDARSVTPVMDEDAQPAEAGMFDGFSSGYLGRAGGITPRNAPDGPWRINQDYLADRRELAAAPVDDGILHYER